MQMFNVSILHRQSIKMFQQVDFLVYALSINKQSNRKNRLSSQSFHFVTNIFFGIILLHANVQYVYIVYAKYQMCSVKAVVQADFPVHALSEH